MRVVALQEGIALVLTEAELKIVSECAAGTAYTPREILECMAMRRGLSFFKDTQAAFEELDELARI